MHVQTSPSAPASTTRTARSLAIMAPTQEHPQLRLQATSAHTRLGVQELVKRAKMVASVVERRNVEATVQVIALTMISKQSDSFLGWPGGVGKL